MAHLQQSPIPASELVEEYGNLKAALEAGAHEEGLNNAVCEELLRYLVLQRRLGKQNAKVSLSWCFLRKQFLQQPQVLMLQRQEWLQPSGVANRMSERSEVLSIDAVACMNTVWFCYYTICLSMQAWPSLYPSTSSISPSESVDKLLHWVLLNTVVRQRVEAALGCPILHNTLTSRLPDDLKVTRQLTTLNAMVRLGLPPDLSLWREPGTLMQGIRRMEVVAPSGQVRSSDLPLAATC
jgi:hypothetical protein